MLTALILAETEWLELHIRQMCAEFKDICLYRGLDHFPSPSEALRLMNRFEPEILFVEFVSIDAIRQLESEVRLRYPRVVLIAFAERVDGALVIDTGISLIRALVPPFSGEEFHSTIARALDERKSELPDNLVAVVPGKAGSGATTLAWNFAGQLASSWSQKLLLMESDLHSGPLAIHLGLAPQHSVMDALEDSHRLDDLRWSRLVCKSHHLDLLTAFNARVVSQVSEWAYHRLLAFARARYETVICDLPEVINEATEVVVRQAKWILVVTTADPTALFLTRRRIDALRARGAREGSIRVVVNRLGKIAPSPECFTQTIGCSPAFSLPADPASLEVADRERTLVKQSSAFGSAVRKIATSWASHPAGAAAEQHLDQASDVERRGLWKLRSLLSR